MAWMDLRQDVDIKALDGFATPESAGTISHPAARPLMDLNTLDRFADQYDSDTTTGPWDRAQSAGEVDIEALDAFATPAVGARTIPPPTAWPVMDLNVLDRFDEQDDGRETLPRRHGR